MTRNLYDMFLSGARIEVARSPEIADLIIDVPEMLELAIDYLWDDDPSVVSHVAQTLKFIALKDVSLFEVHKDRILDAATLPQWEIREQLSKFILLLSYNDEERTLLAKIFIKDYLKDKSSIVRTCALQCLFDLAKENPAFIQDRDDAFAYTAKHGSKAMQARVRNLVKEL